MFWCLGHCLLLCRLLNYIKRHKIKSNIVTNLFSMFMKITSVGLIYLPQKGNYFLSSCAQVGSKYVLIILLSLSNLRFTKTFTREQFPADSRNRIFRNHLNDWGWSKDRRRRGIRTARSRSWLSLKCITNYNYLEGLERSIIWDFFLLNTIKASFW